MSDFVSEFWNLYVVGIVVASILFCVWLLWSQSKHKPSVNAVGEVGTSGHVWDGDLEEFNHPLPKWWSYLFYITIIFAFAYLALYPGLGKFGGMLGWTSAKQHADEVAKVDAQTAPLFNKFAQMDLAAVAADKEANEIGRRLYLSYCSQCHGSDARGSKGFPNLTDADWQWGGDPQVIKATIAAGRQGMMPAHAHLGADGIKDVANYVRSLSGLNADAVRLAKGQEVFNSAGCSGCHGPDGKGNPMLGAPNLTDKVWLYGSSEAAIIETVTQGRQNRMPAWKDFLGEAKVHVLTGYVLSLSKP